MAIQVLSKTKEEGCRIYWTFLEVTEIVKHGHCINVYCAGNNVLIKKLYFIREIRCRLRKMQVRET